MDITQIKFEKTITRRRLCRKYTSININSQFITTNRSIISSKGSFKFYKLKSVNTRHSNTDIEKVSIVYGMEEKLKRVIHNPSPHPSMVNERITHQEMSSDEMSFATIHKMLEISPKYP